MCSPSFSRKECHDKIHADSWATFVSHIGACVSLVSHSPSIIVSIKKRESSLAEGLVGQECGTGVLPSCPPSIMVVTCHSNPSTYRRETNSIISRKGGNLIFFFLYLTCRETDRRGGVETPPKGVSGRLVSRSTLVVRSSPYSTVVRSETYSDVFQLRCLPSLWVFRCATTENPYPYVSGLRSGRQRDRELQRRVHFDRC